VRFVLFAMVGALGLGVHLLILNALLKLAGLSFAVGQTITTFIVIILNFVLNNAVTYRDRRLRGWRFWSGLLLFCLVCGLGVAANVAIANEAFRRGVPWVLAALTGLLFTAVWNYGVTSITTWRQARSSSEQRARRRIEAEQRTYDKAPVKTI
jgi:dolichol-phosphate mannosyltransferase